MMGKRSLRAALVGSVASLAVVGALLSAPAATATTEDWQGAAASPQAAAAGGQVDVTGTIQVVSGEGDADQYVLLVDDGPAVRLAPGFEAEPLARFAGTLSVPGETGALRGAHGRQALRDLSKSGGVATVVEARTHAKAAAPGPTAHTTYVAQVMNLGAYDRDINLAMAEIGQAQNYWIRESAGLISSWPAPTSVVPVNVSGAAAPGCGLGDGGRTFGQMAAEAGAQAYPGVDFSGNSPNHLVVLVPAPCYDATAVGRAALGTSFASGGPAIVLVSAQAEDITWTTSHEFGHTFSLQHANSPAAEYGDVYEVMGAASRTIPTLGAAYRNQQGILAADEVVDLTMVSGTADIAPRGAAGGVRAARFINPDNGDLCFAEYRDGTGPDAGALYALNTVVHPPYGPWTYRSGVTITCDDTDRDGGYVLGVSASGQVAMLAGDTWRNESGTFSLAVTGVGASAQIATTAAPGPALSGGKLRIGKGRALERVSLSLSGFDAALGGARFEWSVKGQVIHTSRSATAYPPLGTAGKKVTVSATVYAPGRSPKTVTDTRRIKKATFYRDGKLRYVKISGKAKVGKKLKAISRTRWVSYLGQPPAGYKLRFQWLRNGRVIKGATKSKYKLKRRDRGASIQVVERPTAPGFDRKAWTRSKGKRVR